MKFHKAKKSLGQNFLKSEKILENIVKAGGVEREDVVLEIGPGKGALTEKLLEKAGKVVAVEKDNNLFEFLKEKFKTEIENGSLVLVHGDVVDFNPEKYKLKTKGYKLIANIPYNLTGIILKKFLTEKITPELMVLMLQYEVVKRILARDKKESLLSLSVKAYGEPKMITKVPARYFTPAPKVDSAVILINNISKEIFSARQDLAELVSEKAFWELVHKGFAHKRKKLGGNLKSFNNLNQNVLQKLKDKRAENLSLDDWFELLN